MTAKEIFKKVEQYNRIGEEIGREKVSVTFDWNITPNVKASHNFETFKEWRKTMKKDYHDFAFKALCDFGEYEFNKAKDVQVEYICEGIDTVQTDILTVAFRI